MFYNEHRLGLVIVLIICISILFIKKIDLDCKLLRNAIVVTKERDQIKRQALRLFYIEIVGSFLQEFKQYIFADIFGKQIRLVCMKSYNFLMTEKKTNEDDGILQNNVNIGNEGVAKLLSVVVLNILPCIIAIFFLLQKYNREFELLFAVAMLVSYTVCAYFHYKVINLKLTHRERLNQLSGLGNKAIHDTLVNYENIKVNNMEKVEMKKYERIIRDYERNIIKYKKHGNILTFIHRGIFSALKYGTYLWYSQNEDIEAFKKISILKTLIESSEANATNMGKIYMKYKNHVVCSSMVYPYIRNKTINYNKHVINDEQIKIEFVDYRFVRNGQEIVSSFNLKIPYDTKIALLGKNGSGKSTLIKSLLGLNDYEGHIYINEHNLKHLDIGSVRAKIGYVSQNITLFNDDVLCNILYGSKNKTQSDAKNIAVNINLHENIEKLKHKYQTVINDTSAALSGGERQKIIIARALIKNPSVLIMDEPFSNLDSESCESIFEYIFTEMRDKTIIMTLHDTKYLNRFDKVIRIS